MLHPATDTAPRSSADPKNDALARLNTLVQRQNHKGATSTAGTFPAGVPVHPSLRPGFPAGLRPGVVYTLSGSTTLAVALLAEPSRCGAWCAAVGMPHLGMESAVSWGADLNRLVLIPHPPGQDWVTTVASLTEITDLVITGAPPRLTPGEYERLHARLRTRRTTLVVQTSDGAWPRAYAHIEAATIGWDGLGEGYGALVRQRLQLIVTQHHRRSTHDLTFPALPESA